MTLRAHVVTVQSDRNTYEVFVYHFNQPVTLESYPEFMSKAVEDCEASFDVPVQEFDESDVTFDQWLQLGDQYCLGWDHSTRIPKGLVVEGRTILGVKNRKVFDQNGPFGSIESYRRIEGNKHVMFVCVWPPKGS